MAQKRLLLLSNSSNYGEGYLEYPAGAIRDFLGGAIKTVLFVPFAGVRYSYADYAARVRERFEAMGYGLESVHDAGDPQLAVRRAEAIAVGGGNTFHLLHGLYSTGLLEAMRERILDGAPYIGWSAGANVACPTIKTTNDMPVIEPPSFRALELVPFQINPHYTDEQPTGHAGETRDDRLAEFIELNEGIHVVGLREGTMLRIEDASIRLLGERSARLFFKGAEPKDYAPHESLQFLLQQPGH
ncbi:MAG TPA: dipeptidase PepE [Pyrinomonadaceae bacterium]|jgi:dipeptidase E